MEQRSRFFHEEEEEEEVSLSLSLSFSAFLAQRAASVMTRHDAMGNDSLYRAYPAPLESIRGRQRIGRKIVRGLTQNRAMLEESLLSGEPDRGPAGEMPLR